MEEVRDQNGKVVGYIETIDKTDYVYDLNKHFIDKVYNNDYKLCEILQRLADEKN